MDSGGLSYAYCARNASRVSREANTLIDERSKFQIAKAEMFEAQLYANSIKLVFVCQLVCESLCIPSKSDKSFVCHIDEGTDCYWYYLTCEPISFKMFNNYNNCMQLTL